MKSVPANRYAVFFLVAALGCAIDLWTKRWIFDRLGFPCQQPEWLIGNLVGLQTSLNFGALFGIGQGQVWLFAALSIAAALAILWWLFLAGAACDALLNLALAAIMAGILGNLYDRLGFWSHPAIPPGTCAVRDWILCQYNGWTWPNFNIADSLLVCGAATLFWHSFRQPTTPPVAAPS
jgi:signal peptidase II